jgi:flagellar motor protein MotB
LFTRRRAALCAAVVALGGLSGCANNPAMQGQVSNLQQQTNQLAYRNQELQDRAAHLDKDNQELESLLAQTRQQNRVLEDQAAALRDQLSSATSQIARLKTDSDAAARRADAIDADLRGRTSTMPVSNSTQRTALAPISIPGLDVRADGDVVRIELPAARIFEPDTARMLPQATTMLNQVAAEVMRVYPDQIIGIEGHTDSEPITTQSRWQSNHQLSVARALAVYDQMVAGASVCGRARPEPPDRFERHDRRERAESPHRTGRLSRPSAAINRIGEALPSTTHVLPRTGKPRRPVQARSARVSDPAAQA